jgi:hypothetical protein
MISMDIVPSTTYRGVPEQPSITFHVWSTHVDISKRPPLHLRK